MPESVSTVDTTVRCKEWLEGIPNDSDVSEVVSLRTASQQLDQHSLLSFGTSPASTSAVGKPKPPDSGATSGCCGLFVNIPRWSVGQDGRGRRVVVYHITCRRAGTTWEARKRYSDFTLLHTTLQQQYRLALFIQMRTQSASQSSASPRNIPHAAKFTVEPLPSLPGRRFWPSTNDDAASVLQRCLGLQQYLRRLLLLPRPTQPFSPLARFLAESSSIEDIRLLSTTLVIATGPTDPEDVAEAARLTAAVEGPRAPLLDPSSSLIRIEYPEWVQHEDFWTQEFHTDHDKMMLAIDISRKNVASATGGPFGAAIFNKRTSRIVSVGMSLVEHGNNCCLHAEMVAVQMATTLLRTHTLDRDPAVHHELFASSEPCAMCIGATLWCGVQKLVCAATDVDVRSLLHDTGPVFEESFRYLQSKGIVIKRKFLRSEAKQVLCEYSAVRTSVAGRQV
jgi:tRNA(Arg) A34 adenosine deaminase TadA